MWKALNDPEFLATCEQANRYISALDGETVQKLMTETMASAEPLRGILEEVFKQ